jgi:hypothetical protein
VSGDQERTAEREQDDTDRKHGEDLLSAVEASDKARQGPHPLLEALSRAYQQREGEQE